MVEGTPTTEPGRKPSAPDHLNSTGWQANGPTTGSVPKVAVVTAAYNCEPFISKTIESVLSQTLADFEMIIVDDGSTDGTATAIRSFQDERITLISTENRGVSCARNRGLEECLAPLVVFLDGDDLLFANALEQMVRTLNKHADQVACFGHHIKIDEHGEAVGGRKPSALKTMPSEDTLRHLLIRNFICNGGALCIRTASARAVGGFDPEIRFAEDREFWGRLAALSDFVAIPDVLLKYRVRTSGANMSLSGNDHYLDRLVVDRMFAAPAVRSRYSARQLRSFKHQAYANDHWSAARNQLYAGRPFQFARYLISGALRYPDSLLNWRLIYLFFHGLGFARNSNRPT